MDMKRVLLPTDFSENSISAINFSMELLKFEPCEFYILNVQKASSYITDDMMVFSPSSTVYKTLIDSSKKSVDGLVVDLKTKYSNPNHSFHSLVDYDNFVDAINQVSNKRNIDFIIMGTKGASGIEKIIFGSNTVRVMQHCEIPVLAIPSQSPMPQLDNLVLLTDNLKQLNTKSIKVLKFLLSNNSAKLKLLGTDGLPQKHKDQGHILDFLEDTFCDVEHDFINAKNENLYEVLSNYVEAQSINMLCMVSKHQSFMGRLFSKQPQETAVFKAKVPFLVLHNKK